MSNGELRLDAVFNPIPNLDVILSSNPSIDADFGTIYTVEKSHILCATTETWNRNPQYVSLKDYIYVYTDWMKDEHGNNIPGFKVGNGVTYLIDLIFSDQKWKDHIEDFEAHVSAADREFWNNKVRCYPSEVDNEQLIFTTN